jgi:hypothetical protein
MNIIDIIKAFIRARDQWGEFNLFGVALICGIKVKFQHQLWARALSMLQAQGQGDSININHLCASKFNPSA